ncbi:heparinase II/III family protein [Parenemella sanctibonifatiensis]|uniref:Heparinase n=1 Tax=Parenemella sanctibonifatiensis TaxID=2016505 RepID=A0A255EH50_9ACTN|nr:heparinase II/III family protein [Parenemella sanctibonifatiensis]OYN88752.1 hypothetical protein CGZ92_03320 [Parenemella sanctibonifatiensis]
MSPDDTLRLRPSYTGELGSAWQGRTDPATLAPLLAGAAERVGVPTIADRDWWQAAEPHLADHLAEAEREFGQPWPQPLLQDWFRYHRDGDRSVYEGKEFARARRVVRGILAAAVTGREDWIDEVADGLWLILEESSWCWPAHDRAFSDHGERPPRRDDPTLDLGAGEMAALVAYADRILGPAFDDRIPGLRRRIRDEVRQRIIEPYHATDWWWVGIERTTNNWNPWILSNLLAATTFLEDDEVRRSHTVAQAIQDLDRYLATLPADGAIDEGYNYFWAGAARMLEALDWLRAATDGALDATELTKVRAVVGYPASVHLREGWFFVVADGTAQSPAPQPWHLTHRWGRLIGDDTSVALAAAWRGQGAIPSVGFGALGRFMSALNDPDWMAAKPGEPAYPAVSAYQSVQVSLDRQTAGTYEGLTLGVKGGHNGEMHNHLDVGQVMVAVNGIPLLVDLGAPTYTRKTFSSERYEVLPMRSDWHNCPQPAGLLQGRGTRYAATDHAHTDDGQVSRTRMQLAGAYDLAEGDSWIREVTFDRTAATIEVRDQWQISTPGDNSIVWVVAGDVGPTETGADATGEHGALSLEWDPARATGVEVETWDLDEDPKLTDVWGEEVTRLRVSLPASGEIVTTIRQT